MKRKIWLALCLSAMLLVTSGKTSVNTASASGAVQTEGDKPSSGLYSIAYILSNYNVFTEENYMGTHVVGPMLIGGNAGRTTLNGNTGGGLAVGGISAPTESVKTYEHKVPSYFKGTADISGYTVTTNSNVPLYMGTVNEGKNWALVGRESVPYYDIFFTDSYLDFAEVMDSVRKEAVRFKEYSGPDNNGNVIQKLDITNEMLAEIKSEIAQDGNDVYETEFYKIFQNPQNDSEQTDSSVGLTVQLKLGNNYHFESFDEVGCIIYDYENYQEGTMTIISTDEKEISDFPLILKTASDAAGDCEGGFFKDDQNNDCPAYQFGNLEAGPNISVMYICDNAERIRIPGGIGKLVGHLVAPDAEIQIESGDYNGAMIGRTVDSKAEGHMWPYLGIVTPGECEVSFDKLLDHAAPNGQRFLFQLEQTAGNPQAKISQVLAAGPLQTKTDENGKICFQLSGFDYEGEYIFRISEIPDEKYLCTPKEVYAKVRAVKQEDGVIRASVEGYYGDENCMERLQEQTFRNITLEEFSVEKIWQNEDGDLMQPEYAEVKVNVYQQAYQTGEKFGEPIIYKTVTLGETNQWKEVLTGLPKSGENGVTYQYFVREEALPGYQVSYETGGMISDVGGEIIAEDNGKITIYNKKVPCIMMPETGSTGRRTMEGYGAGLLLAGMLAMIKSKAMKLKEARDGKED